MPSIDRTMLSVSECGVLAQELMYNAQEQGDKAAQMEILLNGQREAFNRVMHAVETSHGAIFFFDGPRGTARHTCTMLYYLSYVVNREWHWPVLPLELQHNFLAMGELHTHDLKSL